MDPEALRRSVRSDRVKGDVAGDRWIIGQLKRRLSALAVDRWIIGQLKHRSAASAAYFVTETDGENADGRPDGNCGSQEADGENADGRHEAADWNMTEDADGRHEAADWNMTEALR
eukprot:13026069-Heterocapsa_arctica.AAC.1